MAVNKLYVTKERGNSALGMVDAAIGMTTQLGPITSTPFNVSQSGSVVNIDNSSSGTYQSYPHELYITEAAAIASFSWPSGEACVVFGHANVFSGDPPRAAAPNYITMLSSSGLMRYTR